MDQPLGPVENARPLTVHNGRFYARLEVYFPDKLSKADEADHVKEKIKQKIENTIGQPINSPIIADQGESLSDFCNRTKEIFKPILQDVCEEPVTTESVAHGIRFNLRMTANDIV